MAAVQHISGRYNGLGELLFSFFMPMMASRLENSSFPLLVTPVMACLRLSLAHHTHDHKEIRRGFFSMPVNKEETMPRLTTAVVTTITTAVSKVTPPILATITPLSTYVLFSLV